MSSSTERRKHPRVPLNVTTSLMILFPEETFRPTPMDGIVEDISRAGLRVTVSNVTEDFHRLIIRSVRYVKLTVRLPGTDEDLALHGKIVWVGYDNKRRVPVCSFGIAFERFEEHDREVVERFVQSITRARS